MGNGFDPSRLTLEHAAIMDQWTEWRLDMQTLLQGIAWSRRHTAERVALLDRAHLRR